MHSHSPRLSATLARLHAAITGTPTTTSTAPTPDQATTRPIDPPAPVVRLPVPAPTPPAPSRPVCAPASALRAGLALSPGAVRLHDVLHRLALDVLTERGHRATPTQITFHLPALVVAALVSYTDRHLRTLTRELERAGLVDAGGHAQRVGLRSLYDGTLWGVRLSGDTAPKVRPDEWRHTWRATFAADVVGKSGAARLISELQTRQASEEELYRAALRLAVDPDSVSQPVVSSSEMDGAALPAREILYTLPDLGTAHPRARDRLITAAASALAAALHDPQSRAFYAGLLHRAVSAEHRGQRALVGLQHTFQRVLVDVAEWGDLRRPGALLVARLRAAGLWEVLTDPA